MGPPPSCAFFHTHTNTGTGTAVPGTGTVSLPMAPVHPTLTTSRVYISSCCAPSAGPEHRANYTTGIPQPLPENHAGCTHRRVHACASRKHAFSLVQIRLHLSLHGTPAQQLLNGRVCLFALPPLCQVVASVLDARQLHHLGEERRMPRDEDNMRHKVSEEVDEAKKLSEEPQLWPANNHHGHCLVSKRAMRTGAWPREGGTQGRRFTI